jgi:hypothetical protein
MPDRVRTRSTSQQSAEADPVILRETSSGRLVFLPTLVDHPGSLATAVRGVFLYQKKRPSGAWQDYEPIPLSSLRDGEGVKLELKSAEIRALFEELGDLYSIAQDYGVPIGSQAFVRAPRNQLLRQLLKDGELDQILSQGEGAGLLKKFLGWLAQNAEPLASTLGDLEPTELINFDAAVGAARLKLLLDEYEKNQGNDNEAYWQKLFEQHSWVLSQVCSQPLVIIRGQAYVGGKNIDNRDGNIVDFLYRNGITDNATLIEIKTPVTTLMASKEYRNNTYRPSGELSGATQQLLVDRLSLIQDYDSLTRDIEQNFRTFSPRSVLVIGNAERQLDSRIKRQSFELYRSNLRDVDIVTFDELREKISLVIELLEGKPRRKETVE